MRLKDWAKKNNLHYQTVWRWVKSDMMPVKWHKTPTGSIIVDDDSNSEYVQPKELKTVIYSRVSSHNKKDDLDRQAERVALFCASKGWVVEKVVKEVASGMNDKRKKLSDILNGEPCRIVVEHKDRLTRFGFNYFEMMLPKMGFEIVVVNRDAESENDLMKDLVSVITSFCCRLYGNRKGVSKSKEIKELINK